MLSILLGALPKPYAYNAARLYYDWAARRWRLLPDPHAQPEAIFTDWLERLVEDRDVNSLTGILELGQDAPFHFGKRQEAGDLEKMSACNRSGPPSRCKKRFWNLRVVVRLWGLSLRHCSSQT